jgi:uncharacterized membrane protein
MTADHKPGAPPGGRPGEVRLPATIATVIAIGLLVALPGDVLGDLRYVVAGLLVVLLVPLIAANPLRMTRQDRRLRVASLGFAALTLVAGTAAFVSLVDVLVAGTSTDGHTLLLAALQVWLANLVSFALMYWELDRGGPVARSTQSRDRLQPADWRFSQDEDDDTSREVASRSAKTSDWRPQFVIISTCR